MDLWGSRGGHLPYPRKRDKQRVAGSGGEWKRLEGQHPGVE